MKKELIEKSSQRRLSSVYVQKFQLRDAYQLQFETRLGDQGLTIRVGPDIWQFPIIRLDIRLSGKKKPNFRPEKAGYPVRHAG